VVIWFNTNKVDDWLPKKTPAPAINITRAFITFKWALQWGQSIPQVALFWREGPSRLRSV